MTVNQDKNIKKVLENDIILGRGGASIHNHANVRYRTMVREHKKVYQTYTRLQKTQLAESLVEEWQNQTPKGRFLELDAKSNTYYCISDKSARRKTSQLLREGAPKIRRQLKEEAIAASPTPMTPPPSSIIRRVAAARTPSPVTLAPKSTTASPPPPPPQRRGPTSTRTSASKQAKAKLKATKGTTKTLPVVAPSPAVLKTPTRPNYISPTTSRPPLVPPPPYGPRMATPSPQMFASPLPPPRNHNNNSNSENWPMPGQQQNHHQPPRWQQWNTPYNYHQYRHHPYYEPRTTAPPAAAPPSTPLKTITPADTNQRNIINTNTPSAPPARTKPVPVTVTKPTNNTVTAVNPPAPAPAPSTPKPPVLERMYSISKPPSAVTAQDRKTSARSPESVADFVVELCSDVPINSWDCTSDDEAGLLMEEDEEKEEAPTVTSHPGQKAALAIIDDDALHLPQLMSPPRRRNSCSSSSGSSSDGELETIIKPASLSPPRLEFRRDCHPVFLDTLQCSVSFDAFDQMDSLEQTAEDLGVDSSIDIMDELDKHMEASDYLRTCHSF